MAIAQSRRLEKVLSYLYPNLTNNEDYYLQNDTDGKGTYLVWLNDKIAEPTDQQLADAKEEAINTNWWKLLRQKRNILLLNSDWSQGADVPDSIKSAYATYRDELRNLPTTVSKPTFEILNNQSDSDWITADLMPTKPE